MSAKKLSNPKPRFYQVKLENYGINVRIIIGSDRRPEIKQGIEGKIVRCRSRRVRDRLGLGIRIADLNQIAELKLSILAPVKFRSQI